MKVSIFMLKMNFSSSNFNLRVFAVGDKNYSLTK